MYFFPFLGVLVLFPAIYTVCNSFMSPAEIESYYGAVINQKENAEAVFHIIPNVFSLEGYYMVFLRSTDYLMKFWYSLFLCMVISAGQYFCQCVGRICICQISYSL